MAGVRQRGLHPVGADLGCQGQRKGGRGARPQGVAGGGDKAKLLEEGTTS